MMLLNSGEQYVSLFLSVHRVISCWVLDRYYGGIDEGMAFGGKQKPGIPLRVLHQSITKQKTKNEQQFQCHITGEDAAELISGLFYILKDEDAQGFAYFKREYSESECLTDEQFVDKLCFFL